MSGKPKKQAKKPRRVVLGVGNLNFLRDAFGCLSMIQLYSGDGMEARGVPLDPKIGSATKQVRLVAEVLK